MKRFITTICDWFDLGDYEYIKATFGPWPFRFFITAWEPSRRYSVFRRVFPWRLRCCLAGVITDWLWRHCTVCGTKITLREILDRSGKMRHYQSGSMSHENCEPSADFKAACARLNLLR